MLMVGVATAVAQVKEETGPLRADYIGSACLSLTLTQDTTNAGLAGAEGACAGAISTVLRFGPIMNGQFRFCPPQEATPKRVIPILLEFLDKNPDFLKADIRDVMNYVGRLNWPCK